MYIRSRNELLMLCFLSLPVLASDKLVRLDRRELISAQLWEQEKQLAQRKASLTCFTTALNNRKLTWSDRKKLLTILRASDHNALQMIYYDRKVVRATNDTTPDTIQISPIADAMHHEDIAYVQRWIQHDGHLIPKKGATKLEITIFCNHLLKKFKSQQQLRRHIIKKAIEQYEIKPDNLLDPHGVRIVVDAILTNDVEWTRYLLNHGASTRMAKTSFKNKIQDLRQLVTPPNNSNMSHLLTKTYKTQEKTRQEFTHNIQLTTDVTRQSSLIIAYVHHSHPYTYGHVFENFARTYNNNNLLFLLAQEGVILLEQEEKTE